MLRNLGGDWYVPSQTSDRDSPARSLQSSRSLKKAAQKLLLLSGMGVGFATPIPERIKSLFASFSSEKEMLFLPKRSIEFSERNAAVIDTQIAAKILAGPKFFRGDDLAAIHGARSIPA
jgi:hypothetical protein